METMSRVIAAGQLGQIKRGTDGLKTNGRQQSADPFQNYILRRNSNE